jgi:hypothetical protein
MGKVDGRGTGVYEEKTGMGAGFFSGGQIYVIFIMHE